MSMSDEDRELDHPWREAFGQPLPILGAASVVRPVLMGMLARPQQHSRTHISPRIEP